MNKRVPKGWLAPSLRNKADIHINLIKSYYDVCPISDIYIECGQFDIQIIKAVQEGNPIPHGAEYQTGEQYGYDTLREALFSRDRYTCQICKKTPWKDGIFLHRHHMGFWQNDRSNRMSNLLTVCNKCHTPKNHKPGGVLYGLKRRVSSMAGTTFMNNVKYYIYGQVKQFCANTHITYGTVTKHVRKIRNISKTHTNDAYCIGSFYPLHRSHTLYFEKLRRNNRVLAKFYDAKYIDSRDGSTKTGSQLANGRINRNHNRDSENLHKYRQYKISKGRFSIRRQHYHIQPGYIVLYKNRKYVCNGCRNYGSHIILLPDKISVSVKEIIVLKYAGGWKQIS